MILLYSLIASILCSILSLVGILFFRLSDKFLKKIVFFLVAFSSGTLLGSAFLHLIPESVEMFGEISYMYILVGICLFFIFEKILNWHHCHETKCEAHSFAYMNLIGDGLHNLIDGIVIASSFIVSIPLGITSTLAVIYHEIPQEIGDYGVLIHGGFSKRQALILNLLSGLISIMGVLIAFYVFSITDMLVKIILPLAAGGFIYLAASDLIPQLHKKNSLLDALSQLWLIILGISLMWFIKMMSEH